MPLPGLMQVIEILTPGCPEVLLPAQRPLPVPVRGEVLIQVKAAGVNRPDIMQRKGLYPAPPGSSDIPGLEIAGTIVALADDVDHLQIGDKVCALITGGGYAEYSTAHAELCLPLPDSFDFVQAAALPETFFTVWSNLFDRARLTAGETLLVHGGGSGIGTTAIQLAKAYQVTPLVTAGSAEKCRFCKTLGAEIAINYNEQDFVAEVMKATGDRGVDVIMDMIGGSYFPKNLRCLADDGRLVQIAIQQGPKSEINLLPVMLKRLTITGSTLRGRSVGFKAEIAQQLLANVWPMLSDGRIKPVIDCILPLSEAAKAHQLMESSRHIGKIILKT